MLNHIFLKIFFLSLLLSLLTTPRHAQQSITFHLEPSGDLLLSQEQTTTRLSEQSYITISPFSADSAYQISVASTTLVSTTSKAEQSFGGGLRRLMEIPAADRLSIRLGLGLRYERYQFDANASVSRTTITSSSDTLATVATSSSGAGIIRPEPCAQVYEDFEDFGDLINFVPTYSNLLLEVPVALRYEVLSERLGVSLGATVITPLRSTYEYVDYQFNVQGHPAAPDGECANMVSLGKNTPGDRTADLQLAGELSADVQLTDRLRVVASASKMLTNRFVQEEEDRNVFSLGDTFTGSYRPIRLSLGVQWQLGGGNMGVEN